MDSLAIRMSNNYFFIQNIYGGQKFTIYAWDTNRKRIEL